MFGAEILWLTLFAQGVLLLCFALWLTNIRFEGLRLENELVNLQKQAEELGLIVSSLTYDRINDSTFQVMRSKNWAQIGMKAPSIAAGNWVQIAPDRNPERPQ